MIRLYGPTVGNASFARVAAGMQLGLGRLGKLGGFVPIDVHEDDEPYPGPDAPIGVYVGPPAGAGMMLRSHARRYALLAANSSWVPESLLRRMWPHVTGFIAPSRWAEVLLRDYVQKLGETLHEEREVVLYHHGVAPEFVASREDQKSLVAAYDLGVFRALHLASTHMERKGTRQLLEAWGELVREKKLGASPTLRLCVDGPDRVFRDVAESACKGNAAALSTIRWASTRLGLTTERASALYRSHHLVVQPSRGEGFGLVPLEAKASGVPVVMTGCGGHLDHAEFGFATTVVKTQALAPIDDGPGALAPELRSEDVRTALLSAYKDWPELSKLAQRDAKRIAEHWSWEAVTREWLTRIEGGQKK